VLCVLLLNAWIATVLHLLIYLPTIYTVLLLGSSFQKRFTSDAQDFLGFCIARNMKLQSIVSAFEGFQAAVAPPNDSNIDGDNGVVDV
jgi:hypothetical protein